MDEDDEFELNSEEKGIWSEEDVCCEYNSRE